MKLKNKKSLHLAGTIYTDHTELLTSMTPCIKSLEEVLMNHGAQLLGNVSHIFEKEGGFTVVFCIAESHLAVHTWPELSKVTLDVFLCNYINDNTAKCESIYNEAVEYFKPSKVKTRKIFRD